MNEDRTTLVAYSKFLTVRVESSVSNELLKFNKKEAYSNLERKACSVEAEHLPILLSDRILELRRNACLCPSVGHVLSARADELSNKLEVVRNFYGVKK